MRTTTIWRALSGAILLAAVSATSAAPILYDNGPTDGSSGYSNAIENVFGARRTVLDDFTIPDGETWSITDIHWTHLWNSAQPGSGTGMDLSFFGDAGGMPNLGDLLGIANITGYQEAATGDSYFDRPEVASDAEFDAIILGAGTYWFEATIIGPDNNFWLVQEAVNGNELWVNYDDLNGLQPGSQQFGVAADLNFQLTGERINVPEPGSLALLCLGLLGLGFSRRGIKA